LRLYLSGSQESKQIRAEQARERVEQQREKREKASMLERTEGARGYRKEAG
jgi:hypothetical protein